MDDAHLFLREDQIEQEIFQLLDIVELCWEDVRALVSARPGHPPREETRH